MSPGEVLLFFLMMMSGWLPPCHEGAADCRLDLFLLSVKFVHKFICSSARIFTVTAFFSIEMKKKVSRVIFSSHGCVSLVASWLIEHGGACVEWTQLVQISSETGQENSSWPEEFGRTEET